MYLPNIPTAVFNVKPSQLNFKSSNLDQLPKLTVYQESYKHISFTDDKKFWTHLNLSIYIIVIFVITMAILYHYRAKFYIRIEKTNSDGINHFPNQIIKYLEHFL